MTQFQSHHSTNILLQLRFDRMNHNFHQTRVTEGHFPLISKKKARFKKVEIILTVTYLDN